MYVPSPSLTSCGLWGWVLSTTFPTSRASMNARPVQTLIREEMNQSVCLNGKFDSSCSQSVNIVHVSVMMCHFRPDESGYAAMSIGKDSWTRVLFKCHSS